MHADFCFGFTSRIFHGDNSRTCKRIKESDPNGNEDAKKHPKLLLKTTSLVAFGRRLHLTMIFFHSTPWPVESGVCQTFRIIFCLAGCWSDGDWEVSIRREFQCRCVESQWTPDPFLRVSFSDPPKHLKIDIIFVGSHWKQWKNTLAHVRNHSIETTMSFWESQKLMMSYFPVRRCLFS